jgi:hypothetical protein
MKPVLTTHLDSKEIDTLISNYRMESSSDKETKSIADNAAEKLLYHFSPLIGKYLNLFFHGRWNPADKDITMFLSLCGKKDLSITADIIKERLRKYDASELIQIATVALLETAKKHNNIFSSYKFVLYTYIKTMLWEDFSYSMENEEVNNKISQKSKELYDINNEDVPIDDDWVKGITCGILFVPLSELQRAIIKFLYEDGISKIEVRTKCGLSEKALIAEIESIKETLRPEKNIKAT